MMDDEGQTTDSQKNESDLKEKAPKKQETQARKYVWQGIRPKNPKIFNQYGSVKIQPWNMTDDEIDALIKKHPELARLWKKA